ncbi:hypothetical protein [Phenylobacterium sp.]|uniref:hypothetical protein n=1 Tax=Phenylobacterium sp. TaxID=1871053 RepID=UPI0030F3B6B2
MKALLEVDPSQPDWEGREQRAAVNRVMRLRGEVEAFQARWSETPVEDPPAPGFTWTQLERQLADLAGCQVKAEMARDLVSATRKMSRFKPPEMVLREILCMTWALLDEGFQPPPERSAETP